MKLLNINPFEVSNYVCYPAFILNTFDAPDAAMNLISRFDVLEKNILDLAILSRIEFIYYGSRSELTLILLVTV